MEKTNSLPQFPLPFLTLNTTLILTILVLISFYFYRTIRKTQNYWKERGVKYVEPKFLVGNDEIFRTKSFTETFLDLYKHFPEERYHGIYQFLQPCLLIKDPDLIKLIAVKEYDSFLNHRSLVDSGVDPVWDGILFGTKGQKWREMRAILSPSFTSSKMKMMYGLIEECAQEFVRYFQNEIDNNSVKELEMKEIFSRYTNDVIASAAFGLKCNSFVDRENDFYSMGTKLMDLTGLAALRLLIVFISPTLAKILNIKLLPPKIVEFFGNIIKKDIEMRKKGNIVRPDMIQLMMEAQTALHESEDHKKLDVTIEDIISQALGFFIAGFDTVSTSLSFTFYELAINPEIQDKLRSEIQQNDINISYESLLGMKYLDMVLSESLRKWHPSGMIDRAVTKPFTIQPVKQSEKPLHLEVGTVCIFPIGGLHNDPKYFPEPQKFDPERFSEERRKLINPAIYLPFGIGPRNCIGSRFALLQMKLLVYYVIKNFEVVPVARTHIPMVLEKQLFLKPKGGMWLGFKKVTS